MYNQIETLYKKQSLYNKISRRYIASAYITFFIFYMLGLFKFKIFYILFFIPVFILLYIEILKGLGFTLKDIKKSINFSQNLLDFRNYSKMQDYKLIQYISNSINIKDRSEIKIVIDHYRNLSNIKIKQRSYFSSLLAIMSVLVSCINIFGWTVKSNKEIVQYLIIIIIIFTIIYFSFKQLINLFKILKGEDNMYENLEELFTEYYLSYKS